ncbi:MAG: SGNH/GDSL hydrolase family protein, partial [Leptospiraceae bacterium]|nr:SGNH/GDSL hydrolase family protein [Leptospiraceae bacterium]
IYNDAANLPNGPDADYVIGQPDFTTSDAPNPPNEASLRTPRAVFVDPVSDAMWIADWANHRVLRHDLQREGVASLSLLAPNGGEVWITGSEQSIDWQSNSVNFVNLEFSADSGATWSPIADNVDAIPQTYLWTVPNVVTDNALVRITDAENAMIFDVSSAVFSTVLPFSSINLVSPNGYQEWESGKQKKILFTSANVDTAIIEYSDNGGANWTFVDAAPGTGEYIWTVPATQSNEYLIRISNKNEPSVRDTSDHTFSVVPAEEENQDIIFFSDSPTPSFYDPSWGFVNAPSTLQRVGEKFPVSTDYSLVGNYSLKLNWNSKPSGDWGMAVASMGWVGHDFTTYDTLEINVFTETAVDSAGLPVIYLEDLSNRKTPKVPMWNFVSSISENGWQTLYIPLQPFKDNPGTTDFTRIKTIFFGQNVADETQHTLYMDDVRIIGGEVINGDSTTVIVVLGSSTAAGTGPSSPDSAWVNRFRKTVQEHDSTAYVVNLAVGGFTTYNVMPTGFVPPANRPSPNPNNNITKALSYHPTAIVINLPSNDAANNYTVAEQLANYDTLLAQVPADIPVWITTTQ